MRQFNEMLTLVQDNVVVNSAHDDMSLNTCNLCINILTAKISVLRRNYKLNIFANEMQKVENTIEKKVFDIIQLSISKFQMKESAQVRVYKEYKSWDIADHYYQLLHCRKQS